MGATSLVIVVVVLIVAVDRVLVIISLDVLASGMGVGREGVASETDASYLPNALIAPKTFNAYIMLTMPTHTADYGYRTSLSTSV